MKVIPFFNLILIIIRFFSFFLFFFYFAFLSNNYNGQLNLMITIFQDMRVNLKTLNIFINVTC